MGNEVYISQHHFFRLESIHIADFGCGEARLARCMPSMKVTSLDLVAMSPNVIRYKNFEEHCVANWRKWN